MNLRCIVIWLIWGGVLLPAYLRGEVREFTDPAIISFEKGTVPFSGSAHSVLTVSEAHYKHGKKSLLWKWSSAEDFLSVKRDIPYTLHSPFHDNSVATFVFWVYSPRIYASSKLTFSFYKKDSLCCSFDYGLGFRGWSGAWIAFDRDMKGKPVEGMDELRVRVDGVDRGELYFDHVMLVSYQDVRYHTADFQAPYVNPATTSHWLTLLHSWNQQFDFDQPQAISPAQVKDMRTIRERFIEVLTGGSKPVPFSQLTKNFREYHIRENGDGSVSGLPVFFERYGETYTHLGAPDYSLLYANEMGISNLNKLMFDMAVSYRMSRNDAERKKISGMYVLLSRHVLDQGFRAGSAMGTLHHLGYSMRKFYAAALLMHDVLAETGLSYPLQQAMEWFAGTGEIKVKSPAPGMDVDAFNTSLSGRLASILMMDDSPAKVRYLDALVRWVDNGLLVSPGTQGTFKIDGSVYHHRHNYPAYAVGGLEGAVNIAWILHRTEFELATAGRGNLKNALLSMRYYCNLLTWPLSLSGRHPDGKGQLVPGQFARLALSGSPDGKELVDRQLAAAYLRLIQGKPTKDALAFIKTGIAPEQSPEGNRTFGYSCLSVQRRNDWMAAAMGYSRYLWATESYLGANHYGRYINHGGLQILATGNPVSNFGSGFRQQGWDWNHFPGTTAAALPVKDLKADIRNLDGESGYEEMLLSDEAFAGGISLLNRNGAFAMKLHEHDKYNGSLHARKSYFFFDNRVVALGSGIRSVMPGKEVHTTLFQVYQPESAGLIRVDGKGIRKFPFERSYDKKLIELSDGQNNYFFVQNGKVELSKKIQHSLDEETDAPTQNPFALAYINHGVEASDPRYQYMALIQPDADDLKATRKNIQIASQSPYLVLQQDSMAHVVYDRLTQITAYVFFEAGKAPADQLVEQVNIPCLVMTGKAAEDTVHISVCDPDLRFYEGPADEIYDAEGKRVERSVYSRSWIDHPSGISKAEVTLNGVWKLSGNPEYIRIKSVSDGKTVLVVNCQHGMSREAKLVR